MHNHKGIREHQAINEICLHNELIQDIGKLHILHFQINHNVLAGVNGLLNEF